MWCVIFLVWNLVCYDFSSHWRAFFFLPSGCFEALPFFAALYNVHIYFPLHLSSFPLFFISFLFDRFFKFLFFDSCRQIFFNYVSALPQLWKTVEKVEFSSFLLLTPADVFHSIVTVSCCPNRCFSILALLHGNCFNDHKCPCVDVFLVSNKYSSKIIWFLWIVIYNTDLVWNLSVNSSIKPAAVVTLK